MTTTTPISLRCPKCAADMVAYERSGIVLDQCRECRGIFLDRGELERLVDAESGGTGWTGPRMQAPAPMPIPASAYPSSGYPSAMDARSLDPRAAAYRSDWHDDDDDDRRDRRDRDDWDDRRRWDDRGRPPKRRNLLGELLESFGD